MFGGNEHNIIIVIVINIVIGLNKIIFN